LEYNVTVYPNPAEKFVKIRSSKKASLRVLNISGSVIMQDVIVNADDEKEISTIDWVSGLYLLELKSGEMKTVKKILVR